MDSDYIINQFCRNKCKLFPYCVEINEDETYCPLLDFKDWIIQKLGG